MFVLNSDIAFEACESGVKRKVLSFTEELMMVEVHFVKGAKGYVHNHPHLQITYVAKGKLEFTVGTEMKVVNQGDSIYMPTNEQHGVVALEESILVDVFNPMRKEFL